MSAEITTSSASDFLKENKKCATLSITVISLFLVSFLSGALVGDQDGDQDVDWDDLEKVLDTDGDGKITLKEYAGGALYFFVSFLLLNYFLFLVVNAFLNHIVETTEDRMKLNMTNNSYQGFTRLRNFMLGCCLLACACVAFTYFSPWSKTLDADQDDDVDWDDVRRIIDFDDDNNSDLEETAAALSVVGGGAIGLFIALEFSLTALLVYYAFWHARKARAQATEILNERKVASERVIADAQKKFDEKKIDKTTLKEIKEEQGKIMEMVYNDEAAKKTFDLKERHIEFEVPKERDPPLRGGFAATLLCTFVKGNTGVPFPDWQGKEIATKCPHLNPEIVGQKRYSEELNKFKKERAFLLQLSTMADHPNIVKLYGYVFTKEDGGEGIQFLNTKRPGLVMERVNGGSLETNLHKKGMSDKQKFDVVCGLAKGIEFLHDQVPQIVHKDLKPDNLMVHVDPDTGEYVTKIIDFGESFVTASKQDWAKKCKDMGNKTEGITLKTNGGNSTPSYYHNKDADNVTEKWDIFSFGIIVNEIYASSGGQNYIKSCNEKGKPLADDETEEVMLDDKLHKVSDLCGGAKTFHSFFAEMYDKPFWKQWIEKMFADNKNNTLKLKEINKGLGQRNTLQNYSENGDKRPELAQSKIPTPIRESMIILIKSSWSTIIGHGRIPEHRPTGKEIVEHLKSMVSSEDKYNIKNLSTKY